MSKHDLKQYLFFCLIVFSFGWIMCAILWIFIKLLGQKAPAGRLRVPEVIYLLLLSLLLSLLCRFSMISQHFPKNVEK